MKGLMASQKNVPWADQRLDEGVASCGASERGVGITIGAYRSGPGLSADIEAVTVYMTPEEAIAFASTFQAAIVASGRKG